MGFSDGGMAGLGFVDGSRGVWGSTVADVCRAGSGVWVAQARHNFSCPLIIKY